MPVINSQAKERLGYPTQKPESLLEQIVKSSSNESDVILDAYCGCGTTVAVAERLGRNWIGIDITYQSIAVVLKRFEEHFPKSKEQIILNGVPKDFPSAEALAHKQDDRLRKEFEKWAVLTYSNNRAMINEKKGGDKGIDGIGIMLDRKDNKDDFKNIIFSVKSNKTLNPAVIRELEGTVNRTESAVGILITLYEMENLVKESKLCGLYENTMTGQTYPKIEVVNIKQIIDGARMKIPTSLEILKKAELKSKDIQDELGI
jgi:site-specific DNA-methyltransferase (adenine-specific)